MPEAEESHTEGAVAVLEPRKAITVTVAERYGMEADAFEVALRNTVFLEGSRAEYAAFLVVCNEYRLNPLTREIYAFKNKQTGKIVPVVSIDGWVTLCNSHPAFDGMTFEDHHDEKNRLEAITCSIYRKDRSRPTVVTEYLSECIRDTAPWKMQHRMLRHKSMIQCARYAFGFSGIYDEDEAERMEVTVVKDGASPSLTDAPGFEPRRRPRKAAEPGPSPEAREPDGSHHASQEAAGGGEFEEDAQDAEFEDRPTSPAADTATADAPAADAQPATPDSASPAAGASPAQTDSSAPPSDEAPAGAVSLKKAPRDTVYTLVGDAPQDGRVTTYKNGIEFSTAKAAAKTTPPAFDIHADAGSTPIDVGPPNPGVGQERELEHHVELTQGPGNDPVVAVIGQIRSTKTYIDAKNAARGAAAEPWWKGETRERRALVWEALWNAYVELGDTTEPAEDFTLMRLWLTHGAQTAEEIDAKWAIHFRKPAFRNAPEADQRAMMTLMADRRRAFEEGADGAQR